LLQLASDHELSPAESRELPSVSQCDSAEIRHCFGLAECYLGQAKCTLHHLLETMRRT
jgi:hypothetical protein